MSETPSIFPNEPSHNSYDVVIIGGAIMGSSAAWFLRDNDVFTGRILVVEKDPRYASCSTAHTNSCMRQQFSTELNIKISQFAADFVKNLRGYMGNDPRVPQLSIHNFGYMYLADNDAFANNLRESQAIQQACGAGTKIMSVDEIRDAYPFYHLDDIILGSHNKIDEGYFDGITLFDWWRRSARERGVEYIQNEVVALTLSDDKSQVTSVTLQSGEVISCGQIINAAGPRAAKVAAMAGIHLPVEPRKRYTYCFTAETPLDRDCPLTIDPAGVHFRQDGKDSYMAGGYAEIDPAADYDDFEMDHNLWMDHIWPTLATRVPQFEAVKVHSEWAGHYAFNVLDQNAVLGPHHEIGNFNFLNGFSGHGLQQSPAMGRGISEIVTYGAYRTLDLSPFHYDRVAENKPIVEKAVI